MKYVRKAIAAFVSAAVASIGASVLPDSLGGSTVTLTEWGTILGTSIVATVVVYLSPANTVKGAPNDSGQRDI